MRAEAASWLGELGALRFRGADVVRYLQGQLSQNVERVAAGRSLLAGFHNAQGRVIALLRLIRIADDELLGILPRELAAPVAARLGKFVLRSRVVISDESNAWTIWGHIDDGRRDAAWPRALNGQLDGTDIRIVCVGENPLRWIQMVPGGTREPHGVPASGMETWRRYEIAAGEPQVFATTSEAFVSQMLNLDLIEAIAFDKGCYTGQEIIARAHYRGRMKRRMQRFSTADVRTFAPADRVRLADGRNAIVVRAARSEDGVEFLAITSLPGAREAAADSAATSEVINATQQPLPYELT